MKDFLPYRVEKGSSTNFDNNSYQMSTNSCNFFNGWDVSPATNRFDFGADSDPEFLTECLLLLQNFKKPHIGGDI